MAINSQEIDLIIKAQLQGKNTLGDLAKSIAEVEKAIESQAQAAKRGEGSIDSLQATLVQLKVAQDQLKDQAATIGQFQRLTEQIVKQQKAIQATKTAYAELDEKIIKAGKSTERQAERLQKLTDATTRQESTLNRQKTQYSQLSSVLTKSGIDLGNLAQAENLARESAAKLGLAINKNQTSIRSFNDDVKVANGEKLFQNQLQEAGKLVKAQSYIDFFTDALNKADVAAKKLATGNELTKIADEAVIAARGFTTLNNAVQPKSTSSLKDTIQGIIDPARQANKSLSDLENQANKLAKETQGLTGPVKEYSASLKELRAIQNSLVNTSAKIDTFSGNIVSLRNARAEFSSARAEVLKYAEAIRQSSDRNAELESKLASAQGRLRGASAALNEQVTRTRALREELRQTGVNTANLVQSQQRLTAVARTTTTTINGLNKAVKTNGEETIRASKSLGIFSNSGRTTLSLTQRFRGEILALSASYIGFYGIIGQGKSVLDAYNKKLAIQGQLSLSVGNDTRKIAEEYDYARGQADRLGVAFDQFATGYAKFLASGTTSGQSKGTLRYIFESFIEVGKVARLTEDQLDGVFIALGQILSKGKIQSEELRGQLGDRIFGAFGIAAQALKDKFPDFDSALKKGLVGAEYLNDIARVYKNIVAPSLGIAVDTIVSKQARLNTAIFDFKVAVAESGFADQFGILIGKLTSFFKSEEGTAFAKKLGAAFVALGEFAVFLLNHIDEVVLALKTFVGLQVVKWIIGVGLAFKNLGTGIIKLGTDVIGLVISFGGILRVLKYALVAFTGFALFLAGLELFKFFYDQFPGFKNFIDNTLGQLQRLIDKTLEYFGLRDKTVTGSTPDNKALTGEEKRLADLKRVAEEIQRIQFNLDKPRITGGTDLDRKSEENRNKRLQKRLDDLKAEKKLLEGLENKTAVASPFVPATNTNTGKTGGLTEAQIESTRAKYESLLSSVDSALNSLESKVSKKIANTLQEKLEAIKADYKNLENKINTLKPKDQVEPLARLKTARDSLVLDAIDENNNKIIAKKKELEDSLAQLDGEASRKDKLSLQARLDAIVAAQAARFKEIADFRQLLIDSNQSPKPADDLKVNLNSTISGQKANETRLFFLDEIQRREQVINDLISQRTSRIETLNEFQKAGLLTEYETLQKSGEVVRKLQPEIESLVNEALAFAEANRKAFAPEVLDKFIAGITQAKFSYNSLKTELFTANSLAEKLADGATKAFETTGTAIGNAVTGIGSWQDAILGLRNSFLQFAADFLRDISLMIIKAQILQALQSAGVTEGSGGFLGKVAGFLNGLVGGPPLGSTPANPIYTKEAKLGIGTGVTDAIVDPTKPVIDSFFESVKSGFNSLVNIGSSVFDAIGGFISKLFSSVGGGGGDAIGGLFASLLGGIFHDGGLVGASGGRSRNISPLEFIGAPRYHSGGVPGLAPDEYASILQKNEEVLSADNPRNILNGGSGKSGATSPSAPQNLKIMNFIDSPSVLSEALSTQEGTKAIVNFIRANKTQVKGALG